MSSPNSNRDMEKGCSNPKHQKIAREILVVKTAAALVISNDFKDYHNKRDGAQEDVDRIVALLKDELKISEPHEALNKTTNELQTELKEFASSEAAHQAECLLVFVMSHGGDGVVFTTPDAYNTHPSVRYQDIWEPITKKHDGKPLLFFIQACRGHENDLGVPLPTVEESGEQYRGTSSAGTSDINSEVLVSQGLEVPNKPNVLIAFATVSGYVSYRNIKENESGGLGSYFMKALCEEMKKRKDDYDIIKVLTRVNQRVSRITIETQMIKDGVLFDVDVKQGCSVLSYLTKKIVFPRNN